MAHKSDTPTPRTMKMDTEPKHAPDPALAADPALVPPTARVVPDYDPALVADPALAPLPPTARPAGSLGAVEGEVPTAAQAGTVDVVHAIIAGNEGA